MATTELERDPLRIRLNYSPEVPEPPQHAFLMLDELGILEALYGGAAGGGKSSAMLQAALRYVDVPGYSALILRRTFEDLDLPGAIMDRARTWLVGKPGVHWNDQRRRFKFATGGTPASLTFGYLQYSNDRYRYGGTEFQFVAFDELTQFEEADYTFLFSRLRRPDLTDDLPAPLRKERELLARVPLRMRVASNPGGRGHEWVKRRFIQREPDPDDPEDTIERARARIFIPAKLEDNPHVDQESYRRSLANLSAVERARLEDGDWDADDGTLYFPGDGITAAVELADELERDAVRGEVSPPAGGLLTYGIDWGDHTHYVIVWPLEAGGAWVVTADELVGYELGDATRAALAALDEVPAWPGLGVVKEPLTLVREVAYDAAGKQSQRTFTAIARQRRPDLKITRVSFGARVASEAGRQGYKRETAGYIKLLLERARDGHRTRVLAISRRCTELLRQMRAARKDPKDPELWEDGDDHGPDALVAALARIAKANRGKR